MDLQQDETPLQKRLREIREAAQGGVTSASATEPPPPKSALAAKLAELRAGKPTSDGPIDKSGGATAGAVEGVKDFVSNVGALGKGALEAITNPDKASEILGAGGEAVKSLVTTNPLVTAKNILWDGLVKPLAVNTFQLAFDNSLTDEQRYDKAKETTSVAVGLAVGEGFGRAINMLGKGVKAGEALRALTNAKSAEEIIDHLSSVTDAKTALLARDLAMQASNQGLLKAAARTGATGFGAGFGMGSATSNNPDDAFKQGIVNGMAGAFLGIGFHAVGKKTPYKQISELALDKAKELMLADVMKSAPGHALEDLYNGMDFVTLASKYFPEGESHALYNIPKASAGEKLPDNAIVRENKDGTRSVLIVGKGKSEGYAWSDAPPVHVKRALLGKIQEVGIANPETHPMQYALQDLNHATNVDDLIKSARMYISTGQIAQVVSPLGLELHEVFDTPNEVKYHLRPHGDPVLPERIIIDEARAKFWRDNGFVQNQAIMYRGAEYQFVKLDAQGKAEAINMATGKYMTKMNVKDISVQSGRVTQVEYKSVMDATKQNPQSLSEAHGNAQLWLQDAAEKQSNGEPIDFKNAPPLPVIHIMPLDKPTDIGKDIPYNELNVGTPFSFADATGENWKYALDMAGAYHTNSIQTNYVLMKLKNPLMLLGNEADPISTGKAIAQKLKPNWDAKGMMEYLVGKVGQENMAELVQLQNPMLMWDVIGRHLAKDAGYTEVINMSTPWDLSHPSNEIIKLEPPEAYKNLDITRRNHLPIDVKYYNREIKNSKFAEVVKEDPEAAAIYLRNEAALTASDLQKAHETINAVATAGMTFEPTNDGMLWVVDRNGKRVYLADDLNSANDYAKKLPDTGGIDFVKGPPARGVGIASFDDNASFALNAKRNAMNGFRDWFNKRFSYIVNPYSYFTSIESATGKRFLNDFMLPLQKAKAIYIAMAQPVVSKVNEALVHVRPLNPDRRAKVGTALTTASLQEVLSDKPTILPRALSEAEKRLGQELSGFSTNEDRGIAYKYLRAEKAMNDVLKDANVEDHALIKDDFARKYPLTDEQAKVVKVFRDIVGENINDVSLEGVNGLADTIENKSLTQEEYMQKHKFTASERQAVKDIEKFYKDMAVTFGISPHSRIARYLTRVSDFDGNVPDGSFILNDKFLSSKDKAFIYALTRTGENRALLTDPADILQRYATYGLKSKYLFPALKEAKDFLRNAYQDMDSGAAKEIHTRASQYMAEILGVRNNSDALAAMSDIEAPTSAFINAMQRMGVGEGTGEKWLRNYFKISELATQGFKPIAGIRDATTMMMYYFVRFGAKGLFNLMSTWNQALESGSILKAKGLMPGLSLDLFNAMEQVHKSGLLDKAANAGFKYSGQPFVYEQFHAMAYVERVKTVSAAITELHQGNITLKQFERRTNLWTYDKPVVKEFYRIMNSGTNGPMEAVKYIADITGREMVGIYGMANHPFFMGTKVGKLFGQHGQWPLWMLQNFGRLASQGTTGQRLWTIAKVGAGIAAVNLGGRAAGFNLSSWAFSPSNAVYLPPFSSPTGQMGWWAYQYFSSNDPSQRDYAGRMLERYERLDRSQFFLPIPSQAYNILWGMARAGNNDPAHIIGGQILGIPIDQKQHPKPHLDFGMDFNLDLNLPHLDLNLGD